MGICGHTASPAIIPREPDRNENQELKAVCVNRNWISHADKSTPSTPPRYHDGFVLLVSQTAPANSINVQQVLSATVTH